MKKRVLRLISLLLAGTTVFLTACQHGTDEPANGETTSDSSVLDMTDSGSEDGSSDGSSDGSDSSGNQTESFYFPEYEPDPAPTEKITVSPKRIASGKSSSFRVALDEEGKLFCWGENDYGQVGNGEETTYTYDATAYTPQEAQADARFVSVSAGEKHALAIDEEGNLWGWGQFDKPEGEISNGIHSYNIPTQLMKGKKYVYAEAGSSGSFIIDEKGKLWAWGRNKEGQLGDGTTTNADIAIQIATDKTFSSVSSYSTLTYAIDTDGYLWGWGSYTSVGVGDGTTGRKLTPTAIMPEKKFVQVTTSGSKTYAIDENGNLWGWGANAKGRLGDGTQEKQLTPVPIMQGKYFTYVEAAALETYAIDVQGDLWVWGTESEGLNMKYYPQKVESSVKFLQASEGLALDENKELWTWGSNMHGEVGDGATQNILVPTQVFEEYSFSKLVSDGSRTYAIDTNGNLLMWGAGKYATEDSLQQIMPDKKFKEVAVTGLNFAIDSDGKLWEFFTSSGQEDVEAVQIMPDKKFIAVESGASINFAIDEHKNLWTWGDGANRSFCFGQGKSGAQETPVMVAKGKKFIQIEAGFDYVAAVDTDGNFWGWGENQTLSLGSENGYTIWEPVRFREGIKFSKLSFYNTPGDAWAGNYALDRAGKLYAWSGNVDVLGYSSLETRLGDKIFIDVQTGRKHALAIDSDGKLCVWGFNCHGQFGWGTKGELVNIFNYQVLMPEKRFTFIEIYEASSFAIDTEGKLWVFGDNCAGQLNDAPPQTVPKKLVLS